MRVALFGLNGSYAHQNLAIRCLRDVLEAAGHTVVLIEGTLRDRTAVLLRRLVEADADLYGFSAYIWNIGEELSLARNLKALRPSCRVVFGGPEVSFDTERFTSLPFVDCVITGEGEEAILAVAESAARGETLPRLLVGTRDEHFTSRGIHYRKNEPVSALVYYESSRGCPFSCAFCLSSATQGVRAKSAADTLADLAEFEAFEGNLTVKLVDRTFNFDRRRAAEIWRGLLSDTYTKCYHFEVCADLLDEEAFSLLAAFPAGKVRLEIGLQSTNAATLAAVSRHTNAARVLAAAKRLRAMGNVHIHLDLIAGLPQEDLTSFARSFDEAYAAADVLQLGFLKLLHGTVLRENAAKWGMIYESDPPYTILATDVLSFADVCLLHEVAELLERLQESGRFIHALGVFATTSHSPFAFYSGFARYLRENDGRELQKISQRDVFRALALYAKETFPSPQVTAFLAALRADFAASEVRKPPIELYEGSSI